MNNTPIFKNIVLFVNDIEKSKKFYTEVLGQQIEYDFGATIGFTGGVALWKLQPGHEIAHSQDNKHMPSTGFEVYFETENILEMVDQIKKLQLKLLHPLKTESWGQQTIRLYDPDNHLIEIGESLYTFIQRIYNETSSIEETQKKTGVPVSMIEEILKDGL